jgi:hypothetical protein
VVFLVSSISTSIGRKVRPRPPPRQLCCVTPTPGITVGLPRTAGVPARSMRERFTRAARQARS